MTRLITAWIEDIQDTIKDFDKYLKDKTGLDLVALSAKASGFSSADIERASSEISVAVVPITTGLGIIDSFGKSVAAIVRSMGFKSFVTDSTDVDGIHEAYLRGANMVFIADDKRFIAINLHKKKIADNNYATALGYVTALEGMEGSLASKEVLLLGYGAVGKEILNCLQKKGAAVTVYDKEEYKLILLSKSNILTIDHPDKIQHFRLIIDATSEGGWIHKNMMHPELRMVAPGIPLSLDEEAFAAIEDRIVNDYLQIGVAVMLGLVL